jgi:hypothetical protein
MLLDRAIEAESPKRQSPPSISSPIGKSIDQLLPTQIHQQRLRKRMWHQRFRIARSIQVGNSCIYKTVELPSTVATS